MNAALVGFGVPQPPRLIFRTSDPAKRHAVARGRESTYLSRARMTSTINQRPPVTRVRTVCNRIAPQPGLLFAMRFYFPHVPHDLVTEPEVCPSVAACL